MVTDRRMLAAPAVALPLLTGAIIGGLMLARRLRQAATMSVLAFGRYRDDVYYAAALAGDADPRRTALAIDDRGTEVTVTTEEADAFFAASLAGDARPYQTALGLPHSV
jgi:hypothetical protein